MTHENAARPLAPDYTWREIDRLLGLSRHVVSRLIAAGFVTPARGPRNEYRFTFQDLVVLRAAHALISADIPPARILKALRALRAKLPVKAPLAGLSIRAVGNAVVVREGNSQWVPDGGQYLLQFEVEVSGGRPVFLARPAQAPVTPRIDWFHRAIELEGTDAPAAMNAYRRAIEDDPRHCDAYVNLGYLLHERGELNCASDTYRSALEKCQPSGLLLFNLAVVEEDLGSTGAAAKHYEDALALDPELADAHYNLAQLYERQGAEKEALRHWNAYRKLSHRP